MLLPREMLVTQKIGGRKEMRKPKAERSQMCQQGWGLGCMGRPWGRWEPGEEWQWRVKVRRNGVLAIGREQTMREKNAATSVATRGEQEPGRW